MPSTRYSIVIANRRTGVVRRFTLSLRPWLVVGLVLCAIPGLLMLGASRKAAWERASLEIELNSLRTQNETMLASTGALTSQISSLQTIVENAIRHGVAAKVGAGTVTVSARRCEGGLVIRVTDTGSGFTLDERGAVIEPGIGLSNTRLRLTQLYGPSAALVLENAPRGGAVVTLRIPERRAALAASA